MTLLRKPLVAVLAATAVLAVGAPAAGAAPAFTYPFSLPTTFAGFQGTPVGGLPLTGNMPAGACGTSTIEGQGRTGGSTEAACIGAGLSFIGPSSSVSSVVGPTIITPAFVGTSIVSGGNVAIGP